MMFAAMAWLDSRPLQPFVVTQISNGVFGVQCVLHRRVVVERVWIPHWVELHLANESVDTGPFTMQRGIQLFFSLPEDAGSGVEVVVDWHLKWRVRRATRHWVSHLL